MRSADLSMPASFTRARAVDRADILNQVWGEDRFPTQRAVDNAIVRLRQALADPNGDLIVSVRGVGYRWAA